MSWVLWANSLIDVSSRIAVLNVGHSAGFQCCGKNKLALKHHASCPQAYQAATYRP